MCFTPLSLSLSHGLTFCDSQVLRCVCVADKDAQAKKGTEPSPSNKDEDDDDDEAPPPVVAPRPEHTKSVSA